MPSCVNTTTSSAPFDVRATGVVADDLGSERLAGRAWQRRDRAALDHASVGDADEERAVRFRAGGFGRVDGERADGFVALGEAGDDVELRACASGDVLLGQGAGLQDDALAGRADDIEQVARGAGDDGERRDSCAGSRARGGGEAPDAAIAADDDEGLFRGQQLMDGEGEVLGRAAA